MAGFVFIAYPIGCSVRVGRLRLEMVLTIPTTYTEMVCASLYVVITLSILMSLRAVLLTCTNLSLFEETLGQ